MNDPGEYPLSSAFSADGKQIAYGWYFDREQRGVLRVTSTDENNGARQRTLHDNKEFSSISPTDWSPDGKWIAAVIRRIDRTAQIGVFNASDGSLRVLKTVDWSRVGGLRFSPDSSMLAYHRPGKEGAFERDVFVIAVDGTRETAIADSPGDDTVLEWMPDGQHVLIASDRGGSMSVWSVPSRGPAPPSSYELIKSDIGIVSSLGLTRDGVLYYRVLPSRSNIYVASFDVATGQLASSPLQPVRQFKGFNSAPELSGDGKYLAYASRRDIPAPINVTRSIVPILSMETGQIVREMAPGVSYWGIGRWSPDGRQFILRGADLKGRSGILSIDAVTGETALVAPNETCSGVPFWSPDSATVFCYQFNDKRIVRLDVKTGTVVRTFPAAGQGAGASPDGRYIVYWGDADDLRLLELATGQTREIIRLPPTASQFGNLMTFDWTPDSAAVVFYGKLNGDEGMWLAPIDGRAPHKIRLDVGPVFSWRFNPKTGQVAFGTDRIDGKVEMWKMEHFLPAGHK
jgi:Tol biopolymer transport system component